MGNVRYNATLGNGRHIATMRNVRHNVTLGHGHHIATLGNVHHNAMEMLVTMRCMESCYTF